MKCKLVFKVGRQKSTSTFKVKSSEIDSTFRLFDFRLFWQMYYKTKTKNSHFQFSRKIYPLDWKWNDFNQIPNRQIPISNQFIWDFNQDASQKCLYWLSHFFGKNFVKLTFLLNKLLNRWFDEIFFPWNQLFCTFG